jgi:hypothetical protein
VPADAGIRSLPGPGAQSLRGPRRPGPRRRFGLRSQTRIITRVREPAGGDDGQIRQIKSRGNCGEHRHHELRASSRNTGTSQHDKTVSRSRRARALGYEGCVASGGDCYLTITFIVMFDVPALVMPRPVA